MDDIIFCPFCGESINRDFHYCPHCGTTCKDVSSFDQIIEDSMNRIEKVSFKQGIKRLEKLESELDKLESELDMFLSVRS